MNSGKENVHLIAPSMHKSFTYVFSFPSACEVGLNLPILQKGNWDLIQVK